MAIGGINLGQELLNVPMGEMIRSMAESIADAQWSLDKSSMTVAEMMSGRRVLRDLDSGELIGTKEDENNEVQVLDSRVHFGYSIDLDDNDKPVRKPQLLSMMELGFTPTFYQFVDTIIEVRISISVKSEEVDSSGSLEKTDETIDGSKSSYSSRYRHRGYNWRWGSGGRHSASSYGREKKKTVSTSQVNASYSQKYGYSAEGASVLRTKLVPIPPPAILEERIHEVMRIEGAYEQWNVLNLMRKKLQEEVDEEEAKPEKDQKIVDGKTNLIKEVDERLRSTLVTLTTESN